MVDRAKFFERARAGRLLGPKLDQSEVEGCDAILDAMATSPLSWIAYALATAYKETAHAMQPVEEAGWLSVEARNRYYFRMYDRKGNRPSVAAELGNTHDGDGVWFHGRGLVQITGRRNYTTASEKTGIDLVGYPERALRDDVAAEIMRSGMIEGWFTTRKLAHFLPPSGMASAGNFLNARRVINGLDCAAEIAGYAVEFQSYLA